MNSGYLRTYSELCTLNSYDERFEYLLLNGRVGAETFGFDRYLNQKLYKSKEWQRVRNHVIMRDMGCDLGLEGYDIFGTIYVHHMNPIGPDEILNDPEYVLNPEYLICVTMDTHNAIHYGDGSHLNRMKVIVRKPNDHCPWKK